MVTGLLQALEMYIDITRQLDARKCGAAIGPRSNGQNLMCPKSSISATILFSFFLSFGPGRGTRGETHAHLETTPLVGPLVHKTHDYIAQIQI